MDAAAGKAGDSSDAGPVHPSTMKKAAVAAAYALGAKFTKDEEKCTTGVVARAYLHLST